MNDRDFHEEQLGLFRAFAERLETIAAAPGGEPLAELSDQIRGLAAAPERFLDDGPPVIARLLTTAPQVAEHFPRDLLWYLGAECLHFMPDEEIDSFTALDEARREADARGERFNWREARAAQQGLN